MVGSVMLVQCMCEMLYLQNDLMLLAVINYSALTGQIQRNDHIWLQYFVRETMSTYFFVQRTIIFPF